MPRRKSAFSLPLKPAADRQWVVSRAKFDPKRQGHFETIFTLANGFMGVRGSLEYAPHLGTPGCYFAGVYDATPLHYSEPPNLPNWLLLEIECDGVRFDPCVGKVLEFRQELDMGQGVLFHFVRWESPTGQVTRYESARIVHYSRTDLCLVTGKITPENWSGRLILRSGLDCGVWNTNMISQVKVQHVRPEKWDASKEKGLLLDARTADSNIEIAVATRCAVSGKVRWTEEHGFDRRSECLALEVKKGNPVEFEKYATLDHGLRTSRPAASVKKSLAEAVKKGAAKIIGEHTAAWADRWEECDITVTGDSQSQQAIRFNLFHLNQLGPREDLDASIGAKGLHGEGYRGHVFWDVEIYMLPFFLYTAPEVAKNLLLYRARRLEAARENALLDGWKGAKFPWESADTGRDVTPVLGSNFLTGEGVMPRYTGECQHHVTADVAYGFTNYTLATCDEKFYREYAARVLIETAMFWASRVQWDRERKVYVILDVMPPDEFHSHVDNSVYTNIMAAWNLTQGLHAVEYLRQQEPTRLEELEEELDLGEKNYRFWRRVSTHIHVAYDPETMLYEQHEGYFQLEDIELETGPGGRPKMPPGIWSKIHRTQVLKQADVVLLHYLLPDRVSREVKHANYLYYEPRTSHASSLSPGIHAIMGIEVGEYDKAYKSFLLGARMELEKTADYPDGIHAANLGNVWQVLVNGFGGLRVIEGQIHFRPWLPPEWQDLSFSILWQGDRLHVRVTKNEFHARLESSRKSAVLRIFVNDDWADLTAGGITLRLEDTMTLQTPPDVEEGKA